jgi:hypothetical protein
MRGDAKARSDILVAHAVIRQRLEGIELVGGMHGLAHFVLGQADLDRILAVEHVADNGMVFGDLPVFFHQLERGKTPCPGDNFEPAFGGGLDLQILQKAMRFGYGRPTSRLPPGTTVTSPTPDRYNYLRTMENQDANTSTPCGGL